MRVVGGRKKVVVRSLVHLQLVSRGGFWGAGGWLEEMRRMVFFVARTSTSQTKTGNAPK